MICRQCGAEIGSASTSCKHCGAAQVPKSSGFGQPTPPPTPPPNPYSPHQQAPPPPNPYGAHQQAPPPPNPYGAQQYQQMPPPNPYGMTPPPPHEFNGGKPKKTKALVSMIVGIVSIPFALCCAWGGIAAAIVAIIFGVLSKKSEPEGGGMAIAGIICGAVGAVVGLANSILGAYLGLTGAFDEWLSLANFL